MLEKSRAVLSLISRLREFQENIPEASFTSILPTADFNLFRHKMANEINWQRKNDGRVLFCTDAGQRLQIP